MSKQEDKKKSGIIYPTPKMKILLTKLINKVGETLKHNVEMEFEQIKLECAEINHRITMLKRYNRVMKHVDHKRNSILIGSGTNLLV